MTDIYVFSSKNITNIWAGYGARKWAVSHLGKKEMETRMTKSMAMMPGAFGLIYCSAEPKFFTMPFKVAAEVEWRMEENIWPEPWAMPFRIEPLGPPSQQMLLSDSYRCLECLKDKRSVTDVFGLGGTLAFVASHIPDEDWEFILDELGDEKRG